MFPFYRLCLCVLPTDLFHFYRSYTHSPTTSGKNAIFVFAIDNCALGRSFRPMLFYVHGSRFLSVRFDPSQNGFVYWSTRTNAFVFCVHSFLKLKTKQANETMWNVSGHVIVCPAVRMPFTICISHTITSIRMHTSCSTTGLYVDQVFVCIKSFLAISHTNTVSCMNKCSNMCMQRSFNDDKETTKLNKFAVASTIFHSASHFCIFYSLSFSNRAQMQWIVSTDTHSHIL